MLREKELHPPSGITFLVFLVPAIVGSVAMFVFAVRNFLPVPVLVTCGLTIVLLGLLSAGLFVVNPNEAKVLQLFGNYAGSAREPGLRWANPFYTKKKVSLRVVSFESSKLKVNDLDGNPVEIAAIVVWKVVDSAEAAFQGDAHDPVAQDHHGGPFDRRVAHQPGAPDDEASLHGRHPPLRPSQRKAWGFG